MDIWDLYFFCQKKKMYGECQLQEPGPIVVIDRLGQCKMTRKRKTERKREREGGVRLRTDGNFGYCQYENEQYEPKKVKKLVMMLLMMMMVMMGDGWAGGIQEGRERSRSGRSNLLNLLLNLVHLGEKIQ